MAQIVQHQRAQHLYKVRVRWCKERLRSKKEKRQAGVPNICLRTFGTNPVLITGDELTRTRRTTRSRPCQTRHPVYKLARASAI
mmetsp:Transcript_32594/g.87503  ORF Transcript_32594/g.87503 Transcript_32594/m.87503 type:complete len:84 (-) Transcript_32594:523-774(-)